MSDRDDRQEQMVKGWMEAGQRAYQNGQSRTDYPFKKALRRTGRVLLWQAGWDLGRQIEAFEAGASAPPGTRNPYEESALAASWASGWHAVHGLKVVERQEPARREQDATPAR